MYDLQTELKLSEQNRREIHDEVRNEHLANRIYRTHQSSQTKTGLGSKISGYLHHIQTRFQSNSKNSNPEPKEARA